MRVLHLLQSNVFSGAENVVCQIIDMFREDDDIEMVYCCPDGPISAILKELNVPYIPLQSLSPLEVRKAIKKYKPDVVHSHDMRACFIAAMACGRLKLISHIHNNNIENSGLTLKSLAFLFPAIRSKHIFFVSNSSFRDYYFQKIVKKKSSILYNVIDIDQLYKKMESDIKSYDYDLIFVGRITYLKNPLRLLSIISKCVKKEPAIKAAIVGAGDMEDEVKDKVLELKLENNISLLGYQSNPLKILRDSKLMIMTSLSEGTPMCALEAMALGVPIVSTPVGGLVDLVDDGRNGFLSDSDDELADSIVNIIRDSALRDRLSKESMEKAMINNDIERYKIHILKSYKS